MEVSPRFRDSAPVRLLAHAVAIGCVPVILAALLLSPPTSGEMLLMPLSVEARQELGGHLGGKSMQLVGRGPVDGSYVVRADLPSVRDMLGDEAVLVLAVPAGGCGGLFA